MYSVARRRKVGEPVLCHHLLLLFFNKGNGFQDERDKSPIKDPKVVVTLSRANIVEEIILIAEPSHFMAIFILLGLLFDHDQVPSLVRLMGYDQR